MLRKSLENVSISEVMTRIRREVGSARIEESLRHLRATKYS